MAFALLIGVVAYGLWREYTPMSTTCLPTVPRDLVPPGTSCSTYFVSAGAWVTPVIIGLATLSLVSAVLAFRSRTLQHVTYR